MSVATSIDVSKPNIGIFTNPKHDLYLAECEPSVDDLDPGEGEVVVHVKCTGICGSDVHFQKEGQIGETMVVRDEHILGHESAGIVIAVHDSVKTLKVGDRVALEPGEPCYKCEFCQHGLYNGCPDVQFKSTPPYAGQLRRYLKHPWNLCHKIGDMSFEHGALLEPISVALVGVDKAGVGLGDPTLICGAGPIGLISAMCARAAGAAPLVITDIDPTRLKFARKQVPGIKTVLVEKSHSPSDIAKRVIDAAGTKMRVCIECTGVESSISAGIFSLKFAGLIQIVGVGKDYQTIPFMHLSVNEITVKYQYRYANAWPRAIALVQGNSLGDLDALVTHRFKLEDGVEAFQNVGKPGSVKVMIKD